MALWGGRFKFEDKSVTKLDYDEPGEAVAVDIPSYPPGIFVGKFGEVQSETTTHAAYQPKERIENPPYKLIEHFRLPQPLKDRRESKVKFIDEVDEIPSPRYLDLNNYEEPENNAATGTSWPPNVQSEWQLPQSRAPYCQCANLQISGEHERLTSTYTEHMGTVGKADRADVDLPPRGLMRYGIYSQLDTEYEDKFSAKLLRPPDYDQHGMATRRVHRKLSCPRWESSYTAMCRENQEAPNWIRDFLELPPGAPLPPVTRPFAPN